MKALIFGAAGQAGRAIRASADRSVTVIGLARADVDIGNARQVAAVIASETPDLVLNAAAMTSVDAQEEAREDAQRINGEAPGHIAAACHAAGIRFVHLSTDFVFDGQKSSPYRPDDATAPLGVYGRSKLAGEHAVAAADPDALIVRTAWVYAAKGANFVNTMLRLMGERAEIGVVDDQIGTPTHAASLGRALWALTDAEATGIHHFTDAGIASWYDFAVAIEEEARARGLIDACTVRPITTADYPAKVQRPAYSVLDKSRTWPITGMASHWREELRAMLDEKMKAI